MRSFESHNAKFPVIRGETSRHLIEAGGENPGIVVPKGQWHTLECLDSGTFIMEGKDGVWEPLRENVIQTHLRTHG